MGGHGVGGRRTPVKHALTAILLVAVVGTANPYMIALMCLSTVTAMFVSIFVKRLKARRAVGKAETSSDDQEE